MVGREDVMTKFYVVLVLSVGVAQSDCSPLLFFHPLFSARRVLVHCLGVAKRCVRHEEFSKVQCFTWWRRQRHNTNTRNLRWLNWPEMRNQNFSALKLFEWEKWQVGVACLWECTEILTVTGEARSIKTIGATKRRGRLILRPENSTTAVKSICYLKPELQP